MSPEGAPIKVRPDAYSTKPELLTGLARNAQTTASTSARLARVFALTSRRYCWFGQRRYVEGVLGRYRQPVARLGKGEACGSVHCFERLQYLSIDAQSDGPAVFKIVYFGSPRSSVTSTSCSASSRDMVLRTMTLQRPHCEISVRCFRCQFARSKSTSGATSCNETTALLRVSRTESPHLKSSRVIDHAFAQREGGVPEQPCRLPMAPLLSFAFSRSGPTVHVDYTLLHEGLTARRTWRGAHKAAEATAW
jgi:hypothetical protein